MQVTKIAPQILLFEGCNQKELTLTFFRIQEYYESPLNTLKCKQFSVFDFLYESMDYEGNIDYFSFWGGFNIPGDILLDWWNTHSDWTPLEHQLIRDIRLNVDMDQPFYVIGALEGDITTIEHEISHALFFIDQEYQKEMSGLNLDMATFYSDTWNQMENHLLEMGYCQQVISDEIQAYMIESEESLTEEFNVNYSDIEIIQKRYRKVFDNYKNKHKIA